MSVGPRSATLVGAVLLAGCGWFGGSKVPPGGSLADTVRAREARDAPLVLPRTDASLAPARDAAGVVDRVVAVVNKDVITLSELLEGVAHFLYESRQQVPKEGEQALRERLLQRLVEQRLQLQEAEREKITVEEAELAEQMAELMKRAGVPTQEELERVVKAEGLTIESFRKRLREQIMVQKVVRRKVTLRVSVTEGEIERYFLGNREKLETGLSYHARHILIAPAAPGRDSDWETARLKAEEVWDLIRAGGDFAELARKYSRDPSARDGGDLGVLKQGELTPELESRILRIRPGEVLGPFRSGLGYHIFKLEWKESLTGQALAQTKQQIREILFRQKYQARLEAWLEEIKRRAIIEIRL
ncbi:MAG: peptidylprolyl isomerase [Candidatus Rokubacteria bacterium]|nr:peptidylprolyl isomerase [Candidatus Rokubacteria bacterium]